LEEPLSIQDQLREAFSQSVIRTLGLWERYESGIFFNLVSADFVANPHPIYKRLREEEPVHHSRLVRGWIFTRYEDVVTLLRDPRMSADLKHMRNYAQIRKAQLRSGASVDNIDSPSMLMSDAPRHTRLRGLVSKAFTPRAIRTLEGRMVEIVDGLLDDAAGRSEFEVNDALAAPLPITVIAEMLGVPAEDRDRFRHWSNEAVRGLGSTTMDDLRASIQAGKDLTAYLEPIAEERRREPREDLLSALLAAEEEGDRLSMTEVFQTVILLLVAGNETTTKLIGNGLLALLRCPDQLALLREDPDLIDQAVEELLRFEGPVHMNGRIASEAFEYAGVEIKKGRQVLFGLAGANRDPAYFDRPEELDITRKENPHLSLGHGVHFCLGASLARLEAKTTIGALIRRYPKIELATDTPKWGPNVALRGLAELPIRV
jgi:pimeloyl-[acyl-carrier protein] synthase